LTLERERRGRIQGEKKKIIDNHGLGIPSKKKKTMIERVSFETGYD